MSIKAVDLNYVYGNGTAFEQHALFDVNFEIQDGEFVGIIGHTGSGKSTLIQHLNGLIKASSGALYYNGENIYEDKYDMKKLRSKVGLVFQYPEHQLFEIDVLTDVCFGPKNQGFSEEEAKEKAKKALSLVGLGESYYSQSPFELSGGQKRRVAIAGVLAMEPEVLILDEPTAGLDPRGRDEILDQISKLHTERKMTIILVSHSMEDVARYAGRLIVMNHGQKVFDGTPREVFRHYKELEAIGLAAPQVTYLVHDLKEKGLDIDSDITTVAEAKEAILALWDKKKMLRDITLGQYYPVDSLIHRLDPRTKLFGTMVFILSLFVANNIWGYLLGTIALAAVIVLTKVPVRFILKGLKAIVILLLISVSFNLFLTPGRELVRFWIFKITWEGIRLAGFMAVRLIYLVVGSSLMTLTTTPNQLTDGLEKGLGFLKRFHVPVHEISMMMSIALRFIPILVEETDKIMKAQMARGADFESGNLVQKAKAMIPLLVPLFISAFRRATDLAMAMEARCYRGGEGRTKMKPLQYSQKDYEAYMVFALYFVLIIASRVYL